MSEYNKGQDIEKLLKEIHCENSRLQKVAGDIEQLLRDTKQLFQQIKGNIDKHETVRNLFLGQFRNRRSQAFQNVAPTIPPTFPSPPPAPPIQNPLAPLTPEQRILIRDALTQLRRLQTLRENLRRAVRAAVLLSLARGGETIAALFVVIGEIERIRAELEEVRDNLRDIFLTLLQIGQ